MAKVVLIDSTRKLVQLEKSVRSKVVLQLLGSGPFELHVLPNGDKLKVSKNSKDHTYFTIGHSAPFRGNAVVIAKTSVSISNMSWLLDAIGKMVAFHNTDSVSSTLTTQRVLVQMDFWPTSLGDPLPPGGITNCEPSSP